MSRSLLTVSLLVLACGAPDAAEETSAREDGTRSPAAVAASDGELGAVDFRASCAPGVREDFDAAVALLHHMMYQQARGAFEAIAEQDPGCAMAHWGVAVTLFHPLWPDRPGPAVWQRGRESLQRAREIGVGSDRERALLRAAEAFFRDPGADEWWPRIERWADALERAHRERPDDLEIASFHGLALLAVGQTADDRRAYNARAADVLEDVHDRQPLHPGAIHYTIHADDAAGRAGEHLEVVEQYSEIAPSVPHALHMPSHIYVRLGDWPAVVEWNRRSADAALEASAEDSVSYHYLHALDYSLYGHLQQGADARGDRTLRRALSAGPYREDFISAFHLAIMPARYAIERRAWDEATRLEPGEPGYLEWGRYDWPRALSWFARGMGEVMTGDVTKARDAEARMRVLRDRAEEAGETGFATYIEVDRLILAGRIALAAGDDGAAVARTEEAAELERTVEKHPVTPGALLPPHEALGDLLTELERPADALAAYEAGLEVWPRRYRSLLGAARAAVALGQTETAREYYGRLLETAGGSSRAGVREAREFVGA